MNLILKRLAAFCTLAMFLFGCRVPTPPAPPPLPGPSALEARPRADRIDLYWNEPSDWPNHNDWMFELEARGPSDTEFQRLHEGHLSIPGYSDARAAGERVAYRVRTVALDSSGQIFRASDWSATIEAEARAYDRNALLLDVQEAAFRYFWNYRHPVSGLPREGGPGWTRNMCSAAATGMMFFNLAVGVENGWITRQQALDQFERALAFLTTKAERFHGAYPHWIDGSTGKVLPFSEKDNGADLVETAFLVSGALFAREYVRGDASAQADAIRAMVADIWESVDWSWFVKERPDGRKPLRWHWSPNYGFAIDLEVVGFSECQMVYLLALASPTHPIGSDSYFKGWVDSGYGRERTRFGIQLSLGREDYAPPLFFTHYSYLGVDPRALHFRDRSYLEHFRDFCLVHLAWSRERRPELRDSGIWGMTASLEPGGYGSHFPGHDNGTIAPTAALSSMPYAPDEALICMEALYRSYGKQLWGPFGFYDAFNPARNWFSNQYIGIDVGPIAPMIENYKNGFCWKLLMAAPEIQRAIAIVEAGP